ncbi:radical SAM protein [bacterium]|nr:radical SAM protein [bacterium]
MKTVLGGLHATSLFEELKNDFDSIVIGDGESSWLQVIEDCTNESLKKFYYSNKSYELISTPLPRWDLLGDKKRARYTVQTQRGCSKACSFCGASRLLGPLRFKAAEAIQKELEHLKLHTNAYMIELADDNTFVDVGARPELFDVLEDAQIQYFTEAEWIIGENPEILDRLASSGCVQVLVGIESFSGKYKGMGSKTAQIERIFGAIDAIQDSGVSVIACFIVGIDGETSQSIERLGDIILGSSISDVQITLQTPFPGTVLYQQLKSQNRLLKDKDWSHYTLFDVCYEPSHMTAQELEESFLKLMSRVYHKSESDKRKILRKKIWNRNKKN